MVSFLGAGQAGTAGTPKPGTDGIAGGVGIGKGIGVSDGLGVAVG